MQGIDVGLDVVRRELADGAIGLKVLHDALTKLGGRDRLKDGGAAPVAPALVICKEEQAVLLDRPSEGASKDVDQQWRLRIAHHVVEEAVGRGRRIAVVIIERAMKFVAAALAHQRDLTTGAASLVGVGVGRGGAQLLHGVRSDAQDAVGLFLILVVDIHAVQRDVGLIVLAPVHGAVDLAALNPTPEVGNAGLEEEQPDRVAGVKGQLGDGLGCDRVAERAVGGVHLGGLGSDGEGFGNYPQLFKRDIDRRGRVHQKLNLTDQYVPEARRSGRDLVSIRLHLGEPVAPALVAGGFPFGASFDTLQDHGCARHHGTSRIGHGA